MPRSYPSSSVAKSWPCSRPAALHRTVQQVAADLQISDQTIYIWRRQEPIDAGLEPGITASPVDNEPPASTPVTLRDLRGSGGMRTATT
jgi:transposase-like protein